MCKIHIDGISAVSGEYLPPPTRVRPHHIASGALGEHLHALTLLADEDKGVKRRKRVSLQEANRALAKIMGAQPDGVKHPTVQDLLEMDPMILAMEMTQMVLGSCGAKAKAMCQELERDTEVQAALRNKQVAEYQAQIHKAIEQADKARKSASTNAVFDWIISGVETVIGQLKIVEGTLTDDPLELADGVAYRTAGLAGMVKAGAETALLMGGNQATCNDLIKKAGIAQTACEGIALTLDIVQIGRGIGAARALTKATEEVLDSGVGKEILDAAVKGAENELNTLAEKAGQEVSRVMGKDFGMAVEREMVEVGDMAIESVAREVEAESNMVRSMGKSFTREGVAKMVEETVSDVGKNMLKKGEEMVEKDLRDAILRKLQKRIVKTVVGDCTYQALFIARGATAGVTLMSSGIVAVLCANLHREIERLMTQQAYNDFMLNWEEDRKKTKQKQLKEVYQDGANTLHIASGIIDNSGTALANIAGQWA